MGSTRRLPEDNQQRLDRLLRDNWRTQVSTAPVLAGPPVAPASLEQGDGASWAEVLARLDAIDQRLDDLEGVEESG